MGFFYRKVGGLDKGFLTARHQEWSRLTMAQNTFEPNADSLASKKDAPRKDGFLSRLTGRSRQQAPEPQKAPATPVTPPAKKTAPTPEKAAVTKTPVKRPVAAKPAAAKIPLRLLPRRLLPRRLLPRRNLPQPRLHRSRLRAQSQQLRSPQRRLPRRKRPPPRLRNLKRLPVPPVRASN